MEKYIKFFVPKFLWDKIEKNPELKKILINMNWLFFDKAIQMAVAFFVGVWVIRYLGPERYGILSYVIAFTAIFGVFSQLGLEAILVRELVDNKIKKEKLIGTTFLIKLAGALLTIIFSVLAVFFLKRGDTLIVVITFIISLSFVFKSLDVIAYWFKSHVLSKFVAYTRSFASIVIGIIKVSLILSGASLIYFALVILFEAFFISIGLIFFYKNNKQTMRFWKFDFIVAKKLFKDAWPLALSAVSVIIYMKIDQVMIGNMLNNEKLGNYSAGVALCEMWYFIPVIITGSVFPAILTARKKSKDLYLKRMQTLYAIMFWMSFTIAILVSFFSNAIINLLYGSAFADASTILSIYIWAGIFVFIGVANGNYLVSENLTKIALYRTLIGMVVNIILNIILIPILGITGAAFSTLISYSIQGYFSLFLFNKSRILFYMITKIFNPINILRINNQEK